MIFSSVFENFSVHSKRLGSCGRVAKRKLVSENDKNCADGIFMHSRACMLHCTGFMTCMKTVRLLLLTKLFASINKQNVPIFGLSYQILTIFAAF